MNEQALTNDKPEEKPGIFRGETVRNIKQSLQVYKSFGRVKSYLLNVRFGSTGCFIQWHYSGTKNHHFFNHRINKPFQRPAIVCLSLQMNTAGIS
jgi:hypothetical protein